LEFDGVKEGEAFERFLETTMATSRYELGLVFP
jgi:hypothetical protein